VESRRVKTFDLARHPRRDVNQALHDADEGSFRIENPRGAHSVACGLDAALTVTIEGSVGYYCAGMNKLAAVVVDGNAGTGVAENMMSGSVVVRGDAGQSAGATGRGGLLVVHGNASARCGISMKGVDIVVGGNVGHMSAFMAQAGTLIVVGDAGADLGDSIYEAQLFVRGSVASLGADCIEKPIGDEDRKLVARRLDDAGIDAEAAEFRRFGSARRMYNFHPDDVDAAARSKLGAAGADAR
jgi:methylamine---glutamate N-methyltransferase subunit B